MPFVRIPTGGCTDPDWGMHGTRSVGTRSEALAPALGDPVLEAPEPEPEALAWAPVRAAVPAPATEPAQVWGPARGWDRGVRDPEGIRSWSGAPAVSRVGMLRPEASGNCGGVPAGVPS